MHCRANCICGRERPAANVVFLSALIKFAGQWHILLSAVCWRAKSIPRIATTLLAQVAPTLLPSSGPNVPIGRSLSGEEANLAVSGTNERGLRKGRRRRSRLPSPLPFHYNSRHVDARRTPSLPLSLSFELWRQFPVGFGATNGMEAR